MTKPAQQVTTDLGLNTIKVEIEGLIRYTTPKGLTLISSAASSRSVTEEDLTIIDLLMNNVPEAEKSTISIGNRLPFTEGIFTCAGVVYINKVEEGFTRLLDLLDYEGLTILGIEKPLEDDNYEYYTLQIDYAS